MTPPTPTPLVPLSRWTPAQLAAAITNMVSRYGEAERLGAFAYDDVLSSVAGARERHDRWMRTCQRRFAAVQRLTNALRDLPAAGSWNYCREADDQATANTAPERPHVGFRPAGAR